MRTKLVGQLEMEDTPPRSYGRSSVIRDRRLRVGTFGSDGRPGRKARNGVRGAEGVERERVPLPSFHRSLPACPSRPDWTTLPSLWSTLFTSGPFDSSTLQHRPWTTTRESCGGTHPSRTPVSCTVRLDPRGWTVAPLGFSLLTPSRRPPRDLMGGVGGL